MAERIHGALAGAQVGAIAGRADKGDRESVIEDMERQAKAAERRMLREPEAAEDVVQLQAAIRAAKRA